jgi:hypothetical protein
MNQRIKRRSILAMPIALFGATAELNTQGLRHALRYVNEDGRVRYGDLRKDIGPLEAYVESLASFDANALVKREAQLAHWINVYNALILWSFAKEYPEGKDRLRGAFGRANYFYRRKFNVGGKQRTLADIEDNSIRKPFGEPRIHFCIVCASASCPWLSREVYTAENLGRKLEEEAVRFVNQDRNVKPDAASKVVTVSEIFKWFRTDFGGSESSVLKFLAKYRKDAELGTGGWKLRYANYDWSINDANSAPMPSRSGRQGGGPG